MKSILFTILKISIISSLLVGCAAQRKQKSTSTGWNYNETASGRTMRMEDENSNKDYFLGKTENKKDSKIIFSGSLYLKVKTPDSATKIINKIAKKYEGYTSSTGTERTVIRVKSEFFETAIKEIEKLGEIEYKNISGKDVSASYYDNKTRLENAEKSRKRYLELLAKATNVQETILVEKELERLTQTIDNLKGKINNIDHLDAYSTITVRIKEKKKPGVLGYIGIGIYKSVKWLFVRN